MSQYTPKERAEIVAFYIETIVQLRKLCVLIVENMGEIQHLQTTQFVVW